MDVESIRPELPSLRNDPSLSKLDLGDVGEVEGAHLFCEFPLSEASCFALLLKPAAHLGTIFCADDVAQIGTCPSPRHYFLQPVLYLTALEEIQNILRVH